MIRFFTTIGGFLLGSLLLAFLTILTFNPSFFAKLALKDFAKDFASPSTNSLDKFLDDSVINPLLESPETLTDLGLHDLDWLTNHNEKMNDYSVEKGEDDHKKFLEYYSKLNTFDESELNDRTKLNLEVAKFSAEIEKMGFENFRYHMGPFIQFYGTHVYFVNFLTDTHKLETEKDAEDYIKRTNAVPKAIDQLMVFEKRRADAGIYSPKFVYEKSFLQVQALAETPTEDHPLYVSFKDGIDKIDIAEDRKVEMLGDLSDAVENFKISYGKLKNLIEENMLSAREFDGVWSLPNGEDYYKHRLKIYTTTNLTADEIHNLGLELVLSLIHI